MTSSSKSPVSAVNVITNHPDDNSGQESTLSQPQPPCQPQPQPQPPCQPQPQPQIQSQPQPHPPSQPPKLANASFKKRPRSSASRTKKRLRHTFYDPQKSPYETRKRETDATVSNHIHTGTRHDRVPTANRIRQTFRTDVATVTSLDRTGATAHRLDVVSDAPNHSNAHDDTATAVASAILDDTTAGTKHGTSASLQPCIDPVAKAVAAISSSQQRKKPFGPMRAPAHLRASVRVDYQPDVCKDYKETGYCGFGDACKFLHDRSDYKAGWQIDRDWATCEQERRQRLLRGEPTTSLDPNTSNGAHPDVDDDLLPFACFICRADFKQPVMTLCDHYFCESCALARMQKQGTCAVCGKQMRGTFNAAPKLIAKLKRKRDSDSAGPS